MYVLDVRLHGMHHDLPLGMHAAQGTRGILWRSRLRIFQDYIYLEVRTVVGCTDHRPWPSNLKCRVHLSLGQSMQVNVTHPSCPSDMLGICHALLHARTESCRHIAAAHLEYYCAALVKSMSKVKVTPS